MIALAAIATACSHESSTAELLSRVPASSDVVVVANVKAVVESADGTVDEGYIKLPQFMLETLDSSDKQKLDKFNEFLKASDTEIGVCAAFLDYDDNVPVLIFPVKDADAFAKALEGEAYTKQAEPDGIAMYADSASCIAISDGYAYLLLSDKSPAEAQPLVASLISNAKESSFAKSPLCDYVIEDNAFGAAFTFPEQFVDQVRKQTPQLADFFEGVTCFKGELADDKATVRVKQLNRDGKEKDLSAFKDLINLNATIDTDALSFMSSDESLVMATTLEDVDWDKYFGLAFSSLSRTERVQASLVKGYFENIDGTVALGFGLTNGATSLKDIQNNDNPFTQFAATIVMSLKDGKAEELIGEIKGLLDTFRISYKSTDKGLSLDIPGLEGAAVYAEVSGDMLVMANHPISKSNSNAAVRSADFGNYIFAIAFVLNKDNKLMSDLKLPYDVKFTSVTNADECECLMELQVKGGDQQGLIARIVRLCLDVNKAKDL